MNFVLVYSYRVYLLFNIRDSVFTYCCSSDFKCFVRHERNGTRLRAPSKSKSLSKSGIGCYKILPGRHIRIIDFDPDFDFDPDYLLIRVPLAGFPSFLTRESEESREADPTENPAAEPATE